jgi:hypothetical protein
MLFLSDTEWDPGGTLDPSKRNYIYDANGNAEPMVELRSDPTLKDKGIYDLSIANHTDSILCILCSGFISLTADNPQVLALNGHNPNYDIFNLGYSALDTGYDYEVARYIGELILPGQKMSFKIKLLFSERKIPAQVRFQYIYLIDLDYRKFISEMRKVGTWYNKYNRLTKLIEVQ